LNSTECEKNSKAKGEVEEFPTMKKKVKNSDYICQKNIDDVEMTVEVKLKGCGVVDSKI